MMHGPCGLDGIDDCGVLQPCTFLTWCWLDASSSLSSVFVFFTCMVCIVQKRLDWSLLGGQPNRASQWFVPINQARAVQQLVLEVWKPLFHLLHDLALCVAFSHTGPR
jgi:hypothetical protein